MLLELINYSKVSQKDKRRQIMAGYFGPIEKQTLKNDYFRKVLYGKFE
jgi:hypothetical protein